MSDFVGIYVLNSGGGYGINHWSFIWLLVTSPIFFYIMNIARIIPAIIGSVTLTVNAASFDCGKAGTNIEKQICNSDQLSQLDEDLARKYKILMASVDEGLKNDLKKDQKSWLAKRNSCNNSACIEEAYKSRINELCQNIILARLDECKSLEINLTDEPGLHSSPGFQASSPQLQNLNIAAESINDRQIVTPNQNISGERELENQKDSNSSLFGNTTRITSSTASSPSTSKGNAAGPELREVVIDGYGKDVPSAAQNAAQNALTQVVGSFIDAQKMMEKQVEIRDGVRSQAKNIKTDIKEYSQGSIKSFELITVGNEDGLIVVKAKVKIRAEEFTTYMNGVVGGERVIEGTNLFAQAATKTYQNENKVAILADNILKPLVGDVVEFEISKPQPYDSRDFNRQGERQNKNGIEINTAESVALSEMSANFGSESLFVFDIKASINRDYIINATTSLDAISKYKTKLRFGARILREYSIDAIQNAFNEDDYLVILHDGNLSGNSKPNTKFDYALDSSNNLSYAVYIIGDIRSRLSQFGELGTLLPGCMRLDPTNNRKSLIVEFTDNDGNVLQEEVVASLENSYNTFKSNKAITLPTDYTNQLFESSRTSGWEMTAVRGICNGKKQPGILIIKQRTFKLIVAIDQDKLAKINKISLKLENSN